jgi:hypothetical protein
MSRLSNYGKTVKEYDGVGALILTDGTELSCSFIVGQFTDGDIRLICNNVSSLGHPFSPKDLDYCSFFGNTEEGHRIWSEDNIIWIPNNHSFFSFTLNELIVEDGSFENAQKAFFYIDNFEFFGNADRHNCLTLTLPELNTITINRIKNYDEVIGKIRVGKGIDITCEMVIGFSQEQTLTQIERNTAELCLLMSLCRGTRVQWIYYEIVDGIGNVLYRAHRDTVTRPYTTLSAIIRQGLLGIDDTKKFLEMSYSTLCSNPELRAIVFRLTNSYVDAKEYGFLETRGIKDAVVCEIIKSHTLSITKHDPTRRPPFKAIIQKTCQDIELPVNDTDLSLLTASRNHLIHEGKFYTDSAPERERRKLPPLESDFAELLFIQNFIDKMMMRLFGYHGNYINCRDPKDFEKNDRI